MTQEEHISACLERGKQLRETELRLMKFYEQYLRGNERAANELIEGLDAMYCAGVRRRLQIAGCYNDENESNAEQEARVDAWKLLMKCREAGDQDYQFVRACSGIYYHKTMDVIREYARARKKHGIEESLDQGTQNERSGDSGNPSLADTTPDPTETGKNPVDRVIDTEYRNLYDELLGLYLKSMLESEAFPPRSLALYYARILPHMLHIYTEEATIPDTKASSPKWACGRMGKRTVRQLGLNSQQELQDCISDSLFWCDAFHRQLEDSVDSAAGHIPLGNIIYTEEYDTDRIGHWCDYMHKAVLTETRKRIAKDRTMMTRMQEYLSERDTLVYRRQGRC